MMICPNHKECHDKGCLHSEPHEELLGEYSYCYKKHRDTESSFCPHKESQCVTEFEYLMIKAIRK